MSTMICKALFCDKLDITSWKMWENCPNFFKTRSHFAKEQNFEY